MKRNLCDYCKECEDNDKSLAFCFVICGEPLNILKSVEEKRDKSQQERIEHGTIQS